MINQKKRPDPGCLAAKDGGRKEATLGTTNNHCTDTSQFRNDISTDYATLILGRLEKVKEVRPGQWVACCPAHDDSSPSMAIRDNGDRLLMHCFSGCTFDEVRNALGLDAGAFFKRDGVMPPNRPGLGSRELNKALSIELLIAYIVIRDLAEGEKVSQVDMERFATAKRRILNAWGMPR